MANRKVNELVVDKSAGIDQIKDLMDAFTSPSLEVENARDEISVEGQKDKFFLLADIKSGGSANTEVYSAIHFASKRLVAVKSITRERLKTKGRNLQTASDGTSLLQQAKKQDGDKYINIISALSQKNNPYIAYYLTDHVIKHNPKKPKEDRVFIALELLNYNNGKFPNNLKLFHEIFKRRNAAHVAAAQREIPYIFARVCTGLEDAHDMGIIHRDLKPENIMMDLMFDDPDIDNFDYIKASNSSDGYWSPSKRLFTRLLPEDGSKPRIVIPKIVDFGAAEGELSGHASMSVWGTHLYTPPEHSAMRNNEMTVDIFQLGLMLYELYIDNGERAELPLATQVTGTSYGSLVSRITKRLIDQKDLPEGIVSPDVQSIWSSARKEHFSEEEEGKELQEENEKRKKYAEIRQKVVREIITGKKQDGEASEFTEGILKKLSANPLMGNIIAKAMAADPKDRYTASNSDDRYQPMCELRRDILLANKKDIILGSDGISGLEAKAKKELEAIAKEENLDGEKVTRYHFRKETISLFNEIGELIRTVEEEDEEIRTDYRNQNVLPDRHKVKYKKSIGEYFLEDNDWKETRSLWKLYKEFKAAFESLLPKVPLICEVTEPDENGEVQKNILESSVQALTDQVETCRKLLEFGGSSYNGVDTLIRYILKDKNARTFQEGSSMRKIFYDIFQRKKAEAETKIKDFMAKCNDLHEKENPSREEYAKLGDELEVVKIEADKYKRILSACQIALVIYEPGQADDIKTTENKNIFYQIPPK